MPIKRQQAAKDRCKARTKAGRQCAAPTVKGGRFCALRADPDRAARLGRKRGLRNRHVYESHGADVAPPQTASDVKYLLADAMAHVRAGKMDPKLGTTLGYLGTSLLKAIEIADLEHRVTKLEITNTQGTSTWRTADEHHI